MRGISAVIQIEIHVLQYENTTKLIIKVLEFFFEVIIFLTRLQKEAMVRKGVISQRIKQSSEITDEKWTMVKNTQG